ncbi:MAG TPA: outer membrane beta-barrel protein [Bacteroidia bacterium]|nr:outer membrane beta-barrel protein [Bacteroidia bacterium]
MKKLLVMAALLMPALLFSQSNQKGTIQLGLGTGVTFGGTAVKVSFDTLGEVKGSGVDVKFNYGIKVQYGMSEVLSIGGFVKRESAVFASSYTYDNLYFTPPATNIHTSGFSFGTEIKYYVTNKDFFNLFVGPFFGIYTGNATLTVYNAHGDLKGFNYGLGGGLNWYWGDHVGMYLDFALSGQTFSGEPDNPDDFKNHEEQVTKYKVTTKGIYACLGFIVKFGEE